MFTSHHFSHVMCHMSGVTCQLSHGMCQVSCVTFFSFLLDKVVELVGGGSVFTVAYPVQFFSFIFLNFLQVTCCPPLVDLTFYFLLPDEKDDEGQRNLHPLECCHFVSRGACQHLTIYCWPESLCKITQLQRFMIQGEIFG